MIANDSRRFSLFGTCRAFVALLMLSAAALAQEGPNTKAAPASAADAAEPATVEPTAAEPAETANAEVDPEAAQKALCTLIETAAADNGLPAGFFTRLIWKESRFRDDAVSPKGAQGIAQFMPGTAAERGLDDPFDATTAIPASASLLADLKIRFGNLGLAAAAYNAGRDRVSNWLEDNGTLPSETRDYVLAITGVSADTWADPEGAAALPADADDGKDCLQLAALLKGPGLPLAPEIETAHAPWGVQVAGGFSKARAIDAYAQLSKRFASLFADRPPMIIGGRAPGRGAHSFYRVRVPVETRAEAEEFCAKLKRAGGACIVLKT